MLNNKWTVDYTITYIELIFDKFELFVLQLNWPTDCLKIILTIKPQIDISSCMAFTAIKGFN